MTFNEYLAYHQSIITRQPDEQVFPYTDPNYLDYTKINWQRSQRWLKTGKLNEPILHALSTIKEDQQWVLITEPWCGDAAHIVPFLQLFAQKNDRIKLSIELRDTEPFRINDYLTKGSKSIPKLIIKDSKWHDLDTWGPRPAGCQLLYDKLKDEHADFETMKLQLQNWYNLDKGQQIMSELAKLIEKVTDNKYVHS